MSIKSFLQKLFNEILNLFFPIECLGCNKENTYLCDDCLAKIPLHDKIEPFEHPLKYVDEIWTATDYQNYLVQTAIHYLKFRYIKELAKPLSKLLIDFYNNNLRYEIQDTGHIIIPIPLNKKRLLERSFNQSELLGKLFADYSGFEMLTDVIKRTRHTPHQVGLNREQRQSNLKDAFVVTQPDLLRDKNIILIDDVVTTGSTLEEIAKVLKENGVKKVFGLAIAKD